MSSSTLPRGLDELIGGLRVKQIMSITTSGWRVGDAAGDGDCESCASHAQQL